MSRLLMVILLLFSALGMRAEILFRGITTADGAAKFSLYSSEDQTSKWVSVGQSFVGHRVDTFDATYETLTLGVGQRRLVLRIEQAPIPSLPASMSVDAQIEESFGQAKIRYVYAEGRFEATFGTGVDVAYLFASKGDVLIGNLLTQYETSLNAYNQLTSATPVVVEQQAILAQRVASHRSALARAVAEKDPASPENLRLRRTK